MGSERIVPAQQQKPYDKVLVALWVGIFVVITLILTAALWVVSTGIIDPSTPRSYHERQIDLLEQVVKQKPKAATAWADWARAQIEAKQYRAAANVLDRGDKALGKVTPELTVERARLAYVQGDVDEALKLAEKTLKLATDIRNEEVAKLAAKSVTIDPREIRGNPMADAAVIKGNILATRKQWAEAAKAFSIAVYEKPQSADYLVQRGAVYIELREFDKAKADFKLALSFIPGFEPALTGLKRVEKESSK